MLWLTQGSCAATAVTPCWTQTGERKWVAFFFSPKHIVPVLRLIPGSIPQTSRQWRQHNTSLDHSKGKVIVIGMVHKKQELKSND